MQKSNQKLSAKFYGPYPVIAKIGSVAYTLQLPASSYIRPTFHLSLLKKHHGEATSSNLPLLYHSPSDLKIQPASVLDVRQVKKHNAAQVEWLVQWTHETVEDATWKPAAAIVEKFPSFDPLGQGSA